MTLSNVTNEPADKKPWIKEKIDNAFQIIKKEPITRYIVTITSIIAILVLFESFYDAVIPTDSTWLPFLSIGDKKFVISFVEWFGVVYGFLLPQILVRVWEQFDAIDNTFDKEADAIQILLGDLLLLHERHNEFTKKILTDLQEYVKIVHDFVTGEIKAETEIAKGNNILKEIRKHYLHFFRENTKHEEENDILMDELLEQLNSIIDNRGDRISLCDQRLFESLKTIAIITSMVWLVPFYFLHFQNNNEIDLQLGIFGWLLVIAVTFLVIIILSIIEDLDEPFGGNWRVRVSGWKDLYDDLTKEIQLISENEKLTESLIVESQNTVTTFSSTPETESLPNSVQATSVLDTSNITIPSEGVDLQKAQELTSTVESDFKPAESNPEAPTQA